MILFNTYSIICMIILEFYVKALQMEHELTKSLFSIFSHIHKSESLGFDNSI